MTIPVISILLCLCFELFLVAQAAAADYEVVQIGRTIIAERVRAVIAHTRAMRRNRILSDDDDDSGDDDDDGADSDYDSATDPVADVGVNLLFRLFAKLYMFCFNAK